MFEGCSLILIEEELGKFRLAFENNEALPERKMSVSVEEIEMILPPEPEENKLKDEEMESSSSSSDQEEAQESSSDQELGF